MVIFVHHGFVLAVWWHSQKNNNKNVKSSFSALQRDFGIILGSLKPHGSSCITERAYSTGGRFSKGGGRFYDTCTNVFLALCAVSGTIFDRSRSSEKIFDSNFLYLATSALEFTNL